MARLGIEHCGSVQGLLPGRTPRDYDIATAARLPQANPVLSRNRDSTGRRFNLLHCLSPLVFVAVMVIAPGCATGKPKSPSLVRGESIIVLQITGLVPADSKGPMGELNAIHLDSKRFCSWPVQPGGWAVASVSPGRYLITKYEHATPLLSALGSGVSVRGWPVRCEFAVLQPDVSVCLGAIDLTVQPPKLSREMTGSAQQVCDSLVPNHSRPVILGDLHQERQ